MVVDERFQDEVAIAVTMIREGAWLDPSGDGVLVGVVIEDAAADFEVLVLISLEFEGGAPDACFVLNGPAVRDGIDPVSEGCLIVEVFIKGPVSTQVFLQAGGMGRGER